MAVDYTKKSAKWKAKVQGAGQDYKDGIQSVDKNPMQAAVAQKAAMKQRWNDAVDSGRWDRATSAVDINTWKQGAMAGASNYTNGATKGGTKMDAYFLRAGAVYQQIRDTVRSMPNATDADREARRQKAQYMMKQLKKSGA